MTSPLIDPAHIDELEWPALRPGGEDVPAIDDTDAVGTMRRDLAAAEAERDAAQADLRERVLRAGGYAIQLAEAEAHIKALQAKLDALAPHGSCGCSYDTPGQVCQHHSPQLVAAEAEVARLAGLLAEATTKLDRLTNATSALLGHSNPYVLPEPHETQWFSTFNQVEFSRAFLPRLKEPTDAE